MESPIPIRDRRAREHARPSRAGWSRSIIRRYARRRGRAAGQCGRVALEGAPGSVARERPGAGGDPGGRRPSGAWLLVHGAAGGVGHLLVQIAVQRGLRVAAASRVDDRERMLQLGVELWIDRAAPDAVPAATAELGRPFDGVADLVGGLLITSLPALAERAQAATIVDLQGDYDAAIDRNVSLHGLLLRPGQDLLSRLATTVGAGLTPRLSATYPLARAADAHRRLALGGVGGKIALTT
jgi:NADPH2:quinone reductase